MSALPWIIVGILTILLVFNNSRYKSAIGGQVWIVNLLIETLLNHECYRAQRERIERFVQTANYPNAKTLRAMVGEELFREAKRRFGFNFDTNGDILWGMSQETPEIRSAIEELRAVGR